MYYPNHANSVRCCWHGLNSSCCSSRINIIVIGLSKCCVIRTSIIYLTDGTCILILHWAFTMDQTDYSCSHCAAFCINKSVICILCIDYKYLIIWIVFTFMYWYVYVCSGVLLIFCRITECNGHSLLVSSHQWPMSQYSEQTQRPSHKVLEFVVRVM